jgi:hypothetical protein
MASPIRSLRWLAAGCCFGLLVAIANAQPPAFNLPANPQAPSIGVPQPMGAQPGSTIEITLTGANLNDPIALLASFPAKATFPTDANNTKDAAKLRVKLEVAADAQIGMHPIRLVTKQGVSNFRSFCIDDLPPGPTATAANRTPSTALSIPVPGVASGRIDAETSEFFRIAVKAGQRVAIEVLARRIGSALDPVIMMHDVKSGREIPSLYSDDSPGCQTDCRLTHTFKEGGEYLIEVRDSTHRGGPDFWYRLRVGDFPTAITPYPLAAKRGTKASIGFAGADLEGVSPVPLAVPADPALEAVAVVPKGARPNAGWPVSVLLSDTDEVTEQEPNNDPAKANRVPFPCGITGRFQDKSDIDCYVFAGKKGQRYLINSQTQELLSPADVYMVLKDAKGGQVAASNPSAGTGIDYTAPADGDLVLAVEHLNYLHGPNEVYRLTILPPQPGFSVTLATDKIEVPANGVAVLPILAIARRDYAGPIEISVVGSSSLTGSTTITATAPPAPNLPIGVLTIRDSGKTPPGGAIVRIQAKATINGKEVKSFVEVSNIVRQNMQGLPFPPRELSTDVIASAIDPPFRITAKYATPEGTRGTPINVIFTATRSAGFAEEIAITPVALPPNVTSAPKPVAKATNEIQFPLNAAANAGLGSFPLIFIAKAKVGGKDVSLPVYAPLTLTLPFELSAAAPAPLKPGDKVKLKVTAKRKGGYAGAIDLELKNLPAGVTAPKTPIPAGKDEVEIELTAAAAAAPAEKADVNVTGTASGQTSATPNFKVAVVKK